MPKVKTYNPSKSILEEMYVFIFLILLKFFKICVFFTVWLVFLHRQFYTHRYGNYGWKHQIFWSSMLKVMFFMILNDGISLESDLAGILGNNLWIVNIFVRNEVEFPKILSRKCHFPILDHFWQFLALAHTEKPTYGFLRSLGAGA